MMCECNSTTDTIASVAATPNTAPGQCSHPMATDSPTRLFRCSSLRSHFRDAVPHSSSVDRAAAEIAVASTDNDRFTSSTAGWLPQSACGEEMSKRPECMQCGLKKLFESMRKSTHHVCLDQHQNEEREFTFAKAADTSAHNPHLDNLSLAYSYCSQKYWS